MLIDVYNWQADQIGQMDLLPQIFGLNPDPYIIKMMIRYQLLKKMAGTHKVKNISEISGSGKKMRPQKGTGSARMRTRRAAHMRGGMKVHGPTPRSHAIELPKQIRKVSLYHSLSTKVKQNKLLILNDFELSTHKTSDFASLIQNFQVFDNKKIGSIFLVDESLNQNLILASRNIPHVDVASKDGINVYDIVKHDMLILTRAFINWIQDKYKNRSDLEHKSQEQV